MSNTTIDLKRLGHKIRFLRQGEEWTLAELAERTGLSKAYLSDLENGSAGKPNVQYMFSVATALGVTLDELLTSSRAGVPKRRRAAQELPPGLTGLQRELGLSDDEVEMLAQVHFRGNRPRDKEAWRFLWNAIKMVGQSGQQGKNR